MSTPHSRYNRNVALGLCLCFGWFGVHRLFVNRHSGMAQIALTIAGIALLTAQDTLALIIGIGVVGANVSWIISDAVKLFNNNFTDAAGKLVVLTPKTIQEQRARQAVHENEILNYLEIQGGLIGETRTAVFVGDTIQVVRQDLEKMVTAGYIEPRTTKDGRMVYVNEEMLTPENKKQLEPL